MSKRNNVFGLTMSTVIAKNLIHDICVDSSRVFFSSHAEKRMKKRKVTRTQTITCIKHGVISEGPYQDIKGNWKMNLTTVSAGDPLTVSIAFDKDIKGNNIIVVTVFH